MVVEEVVEEVVEGVIEAGWLHQSGGCTLLVEHEGSICSIAALLPQATTILDHSLIHEDKQAK